MALRPTHDAIVLDAIDRDNVDYYWPLLEPHIEAGIAAVHTTLTAEAIRNDALAGKRLLWTVYDENEPVPILAALCSSTWLCGNIKIVTIDTLGGREMDRWLEPFLSEFEALAKQNGCQRIEIDGRPGWKRRLADYKVVRIVLNKDL